MRMTDYYENDSLLWEWQIIMRMTVYYENDSL
jgi:hypothetical protein